MLICKANSKALKVLHHKLVYETIFLTLSDWVNKSHNISCDQSAGTLSEKRFQKQVHSQKKDFKSRYTLRKKVSKGFFICPLFRTIDGS